MTKDEALKLALETLEYAGPSWIDARQPAINAIKEALAQPEQDGECKYCTDGCPACDARKLPQRTWVGLTDEDDLDWEDGGNLKDLVKAIETKLKEKNT